jgi:ArsR family transcriptional regulator
MVEAKSGLQARSGARARSVPCRARPGTEKLVAGVAKDATRAGVLAAVLKALGHPDRLRILAFLLGREEGSVSEICRKLDLAQAVASQQLAALRLHGLVRVRRDGGFRRYAIALPVVGDLVGCLARCYAEHGSRLQHNVG